MLQQSFYKSLSAKPKCLYVHLNPPESISAQIEISKSDAKRLNTALKEVLPFTTYMQLEREITETINLIENRGTYMTESTDQAQYTLNFGE